MGTSARRVDSEHARRYQGYPGYPMRGDAGLTGLPGLPGLPDARLCRVTYFNLKVTLSGVGLPGLPDARVNRGRCEVKGFGCRLPG